MISAQLLAWFRVNKRPLPWRESKTPYTIWISEIMLQQTRVNQVIKFYLCFMEKFPDIKSLAAASEQEVLKYWQGLGYYSRGRNIHKAAIQINTLYNNQFPTQYESIKKLPGVGPYTAGAIASIAFHSPVVAIDGNVLRVISRLFAVNTAINTSEGKKIITGIVEDILPKKQPGDFNQALMELGALVCKPKNPDCDSCPLKNYCIAFQQGIQYQLPKKISNKKNHLRYFNYIVIRNPLNKTSYIHYRENSNDIWFHLFEFPMVEDDHLYDPDEICSHLLNHWSLNSGQFVLTNISADFRHQLSHQTIYARFFTLEIALPLNNLPDTIQAVRNKDINKYPFYVLISKYLEFTHSKK